MTLKDLRTQSALLLAPWLKPQEREWTISGLSRDEEGLPPELVKALRDPSITVQADHESKLANGQTLAEHLEEWRNAPSNTTSGGFS